MNIVRKWIILGASWGAGCGLILAASYGIWAWYQARPKPWNSEAIVATFVGAQTILGEDRLIIEYRLQNRTRTDYALSGVGQAEFMTRLNDPARLIHNDLTEESARQGRMTRLVHIPVFVPAGESVPFSISFFCPYSNLTEPLSTDAIELKSSEGLLIATALKDIRGFVLFDRASRYRIEFPKGW